MSDNDHGQYEVAKQIQELSIGLTDILYSMTNLADVYIKQQRVHNRVLLCAACVLLGCLSIAAFV